MNALRSACIAFTAGAVTLVSPVVASAHTVGAVGADAVVSWTAGKSNKQKSATFHIDFLGVAEVTDGYRWSYQIERTAGDLGISHLVAFFGDCLDLTPANYSSTIVDYGTNLGIKAGESFRAGYGYDGSTGGTGLKWDEIEDQNDMGEFWFVLSQNFEQTDDFVIRVKAGNGYADASLVGPGCEVVTTVAPTPAAAGLGLALLGGLAMVRRRELMG